MNINKLGTEIVNRLFITGKKKTAEATGLLILLLSGFMPEEIAKNIVTGLGGLWAAYKLYDKD